MKARLFCAASMHIPWRSSLSQSMTVRSAIVALTATVGEIKALPSVCYDFKYSSSKSSLPQTCMDLRGVFTTLIGQNRSAVPTN